MPSLFFFLQNRGEKLLSHTSGMLIKEPSHGSVWLFGCLSHDARTYILFPYWTNVVPLQLSHPPITHRCLHTILKAYTEVYAILAYSSVVEQQIVNLWVAGSIPTMPVKQSKHGVEWWFESTCEHNSSEKGTHRFFPNVLSDIKKIRGERQRLVVLRQTVNLFPCGKQ